ncbi:ester cyclase [Kutzneria buriramensis]|uniref:Putative SnoaL-like aldol condensation-catalyzing enzyme n=1 Tax=Kutzneria buriramensis TaxID=1045776 RepID=A0A3E0GZH1_9PSEU|nr:ester cyclase [Kutzneria buriramensis]REH33043.1 putative SnoaL-like aldol condensation-catalyzing enzyme [Kutzneria buriramensis]
MAIDENKRTAVDFFERTFNQKDPEGAAAAYLGDHYIQHNPRAADGAEGFVAFINANRERAPQTRVEIKRAVAEGDHVVLHNRFIRPGVPDLATIDIFRLEQGKIVEHWDVIQEVPEAAANANTMF